jgi:hypothetical protein
MSSFAYPRSHCHSHILQVKISPCHLNLSRPVEGISTEHGSPSLKRSGRTGKGVSFHNAVLLPHFADVTTVATVTKNLAWLWASRTQAEEDECDRLVANQSVALPTIDPSILPVKSIAKADDPPHPRAAGRGQGVGPAPQPPPPIPTATAASNIAPPLLPSPPPPATPGAAPINPVNASAATGPSSILVRAGEYTA